jgi:hypothetical protein
MRTSWHGYRRQRQLQQQQKAGMMIAALKRQQLQVQQMAGMRVAAQQQQQQTVQDRQQQQQQTVTMRLMQQVPRKAWVEQHQGLGLISVLLLLVLLLLRKGWKRGSTAGRQKCMATALLLMLA